MARVEPRRYNGDAQLEFTFLEDIHPDRNKSLVLWQDDANPVMNTIQLRNGIFSAKTAHAGTRMYNERELWIRMTTAVVEWQDYLDFEKPGHPTEPYNLDDLKADLTEAVPGWEVYHMGLSGFQHFTWRDSWLTVETQRLFAAKIAAVAVNHAIDWTRARITLTMGKIEFLAYFVQDAE